MEITSGEIFILLPNTSEWQIFSERIPPSRFQLIVHSRLK